MRSAHLAAQRDEEHTFALAGTEIVADPSGALYWPDERMLVVADLHLEKGSAFAKRGVLLPPYDTASTLMRLAGLLHRYAPRSVVALGDSFHDGDGPRRMSSADATTMRALRTGRDWIWIAGNHDAELPRDIGGSFAASLAVGPLIFRHLPSAGIADGEVAGHLQHQDAIARSLEDEGLAEAVDLIDARAGARVGQEDQPGVQHHADAVSH